MVEPVGNQPRKPPTEDGGMSSIPGNSHKDRVAGNESIGEREPIEKIVEGKVVSRKLPWYTRFARSMVADDASQVGDYILTDVIIPATKNLILDMISQTTERVLFGTSNGRISRMRRSPLGMSLRDQVNYSGVSRDRDRDSRRFMSREARARHDFQEIVLDDRIEAEEVIAGLVSRIARYGSVTVSELYEFVGITGSHADRRWGWTDLVTADVRQVPGGFLLDLPEPEPIR